MCNMENSLIKNLIKLIEERKRAEDSANENVDKISSEIERLYAKRDIAIDQHLEEKRKLLNELNEISKIVPINILDLVRETLKIKHANKAKIIERDKSLKIDYGYSCTPILTDIDVNSVINGKRLFAVKTNKSGVENFVYNDEKSGQERLKFIIETLKNRNNNGLWSGLVDSYFWVTGNLYSEQQEVIINLREKCGKNKMLFDYVNHAEYEFVPTIKNRRAYYQIAVVLGFDDFEKSSNFNVKLNLNDSLDIENDNIEINYLIDTTLQAYYNVIKKSLKQKLVQQEDKEI